jgi:tetratricopeptide (TPR) repeat protein
VRPKIVRSTPFCLRNLFRIAVTSILIVLARFETAWAQPALEIDEHSRQVRERYEKSLHQTPLQDQAFDRIYESYLEFEGVDVWIKKLQDETQSTATKPAALVLLGRIYQRQFKPADAIKSLEEARGLGMDGPDLQALLGALYADASKFDRAVKLLSGAMDGLTDPVKLAKCSRELGSVYMRLGKRDDAVAAWQRLITASPNDPFAYEELASIYEDNLMWTEAIGVRKSQLDSAANNPYLQCRIYRAVGHAHERAGALPDAIASYEQALSLAAPGNWLFEDVKDRLVGVYERQGDLAGLQQYLQVRIDASPSDVEFRELLAETLSRQNKFDDAEKALLEIIERAPGRTNAFEKLIAIYTQMEAKDKARQTLDKLVSAYPNEPDYLRRLGELYLLDGDPAKAKETWQRVTATDPSPDGFALLASWYERYEFPDDAIAAYAQALKGKPDVEWTNRLAALTFEAGKSDEAIALWKSTLTGQSKAADYAQVATLLSTHSAVGQAIELYRKAIEMDPPALEQRAALGRLFISEKKFDDALEQFTVLANQTENEFFRNTGERGMIEVFVATNTLEEKQKEWLEEIKKFPDQVAPMLRLARLRQRIGDRQGEIELYLKCASLEPQASEHLRSIATAYQAFRQSDMAIATYLKLIELDSGRAGQYYRELIDLYGNTNKKDEAIAAAQKVVELTPSDAEARVVLAQTYLRYERPDEALQQYRTALRMDPGKPGLFRQYGDVLSNQQRWGEAQDAYRSMLDAAKTDGDRVDAVMSLARVYQQQDRFAELEQEFKDRLRATPKGLEAYRELAAIYAAANDHARRVETFELATESVDDKPEALRALLNAASDAGQLEKVIGASQQLMALSGKPTLYDWDRLGSTYAQLGEFDKAKEAWQHMTQENPNDPAAHKAYARTASNWGLVDESLEARKKAIALDPKDYNFRFEYAQLLSSYDRIDEAVQELFALLEASQMGEESAPAGKPNAPANQLAPGGFYPGSAPIPTMNRPGRRNNMRSGGIRWGRGALAGIGGPQPAYGTLAYIRPQLIYTLADIARRTESTDAVLDRLNKRMEAMPSNVAIKQDLFEIYANLAKYDEALALAKILVDQQPDDNHMRFRYAALLQQQKKYDDAEIEYTTLASRDPSMAMEAQYAILYLCQTKGDTARLEELINKLLAENPANASVVIRIAQLLQNEPDGERVKALYTKAIELDPKNALNYRWQLAQQAQNRGDIENARKGYEEVVFAPASQPANVASAQSRANVYIPDPHSGRGNFSSLPGIQSDHQRQQALTQLTQMTLHIEDLAPLLERLRTDAETYFAADTADKKQAELFRVWLYFGQLVAMEKWDDAFAFANRLTTSDPAILAFHNVRLFILNQRQSWSDMLAAYGEVEKLYPAEIQNVLRARFFIALQRDEIDAAIAFARQLNAQGTGQQQNEIYMLTQYLREKDKIDLAIPFLEEKAASRSGNATNWQMLAEAYTQGGKTEKAIEAARRAWEIGQRNSGGPSTFGRSGRSATNSPGFYALLNAYSAAHKMPELIVEFEDRLKKQPDSLSIRACLVQMYEQNGRPNDAIALKQQLAEMRPNSVDVKMDLAQFLVNHNHADDAIKIFEEILQQKPNLYFSLNWQIRQAYQTAGRQQDLKKVEQQMADRATSAQQLEQLAQQFMSDQSFDRAAETYGRAIKLDPNRGYLRLQLANAYRQGGKDEEALKVYREHLALAKQNNNNFADMNTTQQIASVYASMDRLQELKDETDKSLQADPADKMARAMQIQIARTEKRFDDATKLLDELYVAQPDTQIISEMINVAEEAKDYDRAIDLLEKRLIPLGNREWSRLARLYLDKGDRKKAYETWQREASDQNNPWAATQVMQNLVQHALWEEAEEFYRASVVKRAGNKDIIRQLNQSLIEAATRSERIATFVETEVLSAKSPENPDMLRQYLSRISENQKKVKSLLDPLIAAEPDNERYLSIYADYAGRYGENKSNTPIYAKLFELKPENDDYLRKYALNLVQTGQAKAATDLAYIWAMKDPTPQRISVLASILGNYEAMNAVDVFELRDKVLAAVPADSLIAAKAAFADTIASAGDVAWAVEAAKGLYESRQDDDSLARYASFLVQSNYHDAARALIHSKGDAGINAFKARSWNLLVELMLAGGDVEIAEQFASQLMASGRGDINSISAYRDYLGTERLVQSLETKVLSEPSPSFQSLLFLARVYIELDNPRRALQLVDKALEKAPQNNEAMNVLNELIYRIRDEKLQLSVVDRIVAASKIRGSQNNPWLHHAANIYVQLGRKGDLLKLLDEEFDKAPLPSNKIVFAELYLRADAPGKALELIEAAGNEAAKPQYTNTTMNVYLANGRVDEAMATWRANRQTRSDGPNAKRLMELGRFQDAIEVLRFQAEKQSQNVDTWVNLATAHLKGGADEKTWREVFTQAYEATQRYASNSFAYDYGVFLNENNLTDSAAASPSILEDALLRRAVANAYQQQIQKGDESAKEKFRSYAAQHAGSDRYLTVECARIYQQLGDRDRAIELFRSTASNAESNAQQLRESADALAGLADPTAVPAYLRLLDTGKWRKSDDLMGICQHAGKGDSAAWQPFIDRLAEFCQSGADANFCRAYIDHTAGRKEAAVASFATLLGESKLRGGYAFEAAKIMRNERKREEAIQLLRIATTDGNHALLRTQALDRLATWQAEDGNVDDAVVTLSRLRSSERLQSTEAWQAICLKAQPDALKQSVSREIQASSTNDRVSDLLTLYADVLRKNGTPVPMEQLAAEFGVSGREADEAKLLDGMIEDWTISSPLNVSQDPKSKDTMDSLGEKIKNALLPGSPLPDQGLTWFKVRPEDFGGIVWLDKLPKMKAEKTSGVAAFAITEVDCPQEMAVTFTHASDNWVRIWVNGEEVNRNLNGRSLYLDQDRFTAQLHTGKNRIVVETGNQSENWGFCLGMLDAPQGTTVQSPN